jgi:hypothetical protein
MCTSKESPGRPIFIFFFNSVEILRFLQTPAESPYALMNAWKNLEETTHLCDHRTIVWRSIGRKKRKNGDARYGPCQEFKALR